MEKINIEKFQKLSNEDMQNIYGGIGWRTVSISLHTFVDGQITEIVSERTNLFGKVKETRTDVLSDN